MLTGNKRFFNRLASERPAQRTYFSSDEVGLWPKGSLEALKSSGLLRKATQAKRIECWGCPEHCLRPVEIQVSHSGDRKRMGVLCDLRDNVTWIDIPSHRLARWSSAPQHVIAFFAAELDLSVPSDVSVPGLTPIGTLRNHKRRPLISIAFSETISIQVGNQSVQPSELIDSDGKRFHLNVSLLHAIADSSVQHYTDNKPYTPSRARQQLKMLQTAERDRKLQIAFDHLKAKFPARSKADIAKEIAKSGDFPGVSAERIERIVRVRKN